MDTESTRLPSYNEALEWGVAPPPRPQWAPPRPPPREGASSPRLRAARSRNGPFRPFSMSTIDETLANSMSRPQTAAGRAGRPSSLLNIGLDAIRLDQLGSNSRQSTLPARPSTSQGFRPARRPSYSSTPSAPAAPASPASSNNGFLRPPTPLEDPPPSPAYSVVPEPLPQHIRPLVPPDYARHDPIARTYLLHSPLVYTTTGSSPQTAAYHLDASLTRTGKANQLRVRPLDHIESRTLSLREDRSSLEYDHDDTLYLLQVMQLLGGFGVPGLGFGPSWRVEITPKNTSGRNTGFIRFEGGGFLGTGRGLTQKSGCKFWYMTRKTDLKSAHEWKLMNKYGWQPDFEWNKRLMFSVEKKRAVTGKNKGYEWRDGKGRLVAIESNNDRLDLTGLATSMSVQSREALVACWIGKAWAKGVLTC